MLYSSSIRSLWRFVCPGDNISYHGHGISYFSLTLVLLTSCWEGGLIDCRRRRSLVRLLFFADVYVSITQMNPGGSRVCLCCDAFACTGNFPRGA